MLRSITSRQFLELEAHAYLDPFGELRADYRTALIVQTLRNIHRGEDQPAFELEAFLLKFGDEAEKIREAASAPKQTWQQQKQVAYAIALAQAKAVKDGTAAKDLKRP